MGFNTKEPARTIDLYLKQGSDLIQTVPWNVGGVNVDFTGAAARLPIFVDRYGDMLGLTSTASPFGGIVLGTIALSTAGTIVFTITKSATQALASVGMQRAPHSLYVDWPNGTSVCLFAGNTYLAAGSPF